MSIVFWVPSTLVDKRINRSIANGIPNTIHYLATWQAQCGATIMWSIFSKKTHKRHPITCPWGDYHQSSLFIGIQLKKSQHWFRWWLSRQIGDEPLFESMLRKYGITGDQWVNLHCTNVNRTCLCYIWHARHRKKAVKRHHTANSEAILKHNSLKKHIVSRTSVKRSLSVVLTLKHRETHGCVVSTVATDALVLKHQAISIHNAD